MKRRALRSVAGIAGGVAIITGSIAVLYWTGTAGQDETGSRDAAGTVAIYSGIVAVVSVLAQFTLALGGRLAATARSPRAHQRSLPDLCRLRKGSRLQMISEVSDLRLLGVHAPRGIQGTPTATMPPYVARDADETVRRVLASNRFVLLVGQSSAGKSRTAYEALRVTHPRLHVIVPLNTAALAEMVDRGLLPSRGVLWLDNIESYLISSLTAVRLNEILQRSGITIVATMRDAEYIRFRSGDAEGGLGPSDISDARNVLDAATNVRLERAWSAAERAAAHSLAATDPRIEHAVRLADSFGLAEYIAAARDLLEQWEGAWDIPGHAVGAAIVEAAVDCRRIGITEPVGLDLLRDLHRAYLERRGGRRLNPASFDEDLTWAITPILGTVGLLIPTGEGYEAFDYLVDYTQSNADSRAVPQSTWTAVLRALPAQGFTLGANAYASGFPDVAEECWSSAADRGDTRAMEALSVLYERTPGRAADADAWLRSAAALRHPDACHRLGERLMDGGRVNEAIEYLGFASDQAHVEASFTLGVLLDRLGQDERARQRLSVAAEAGHAAAALKLGRLAEGDGREDEALRWLTIAAEAADAEAAYRMGVLRGGRRQTDEARRWFEAAARGGHVGAMYELGVLAASASDAAAAEQWLRSAVRGGHIAAAFKLGELMIDARRDEELGTIVESAFEAGAPQMLIDYRLGVREVLPELILAFDWLLDEESEHKLSQPLLRLALAGNQIAVLAAIYVHDDSAADSGAGAALEEAAVSGNPHAYLILAGIAARRGDAAECRRLLQLSAEAGNPLATACAGAFAMSDSEPDTAWYLPDPDRPEDPFALTLTAALLHQAGRVMEYEQVLTRLGTVAPLGVVDAACVASAIAIFGRPDAVEMLLLHGPIAEDVVLFLRIFLYGSLGRVDELAALAREALANGAVPHYLMVLTAMTFEQDSAAQLLALAGASAREGHPLALLTVLVAGLSERGVRDEAEAILRASAAGANVVGGFLLLILLAGSGRTDDIRTLLSDWPGPAGPVAQLGLILLTFFEGPDLAEHEGLATQQKVADFFAVENPLMDGLLRYFLGAQAADGETYTLDSLTDEDYAVMKANAVALLATGTPDRNEAIAFLTHALRSRDPFATVCAVGLLRLGTAEVVSTVSAAGAPDNMAALLAGLDRRDERKAAESIGHISTVGAVLRSIERDSRFGPLEWLSLLRLAGGLRSQAPSMSRWARLRYQARRTYFRFVRTVMPARWRRARQKAMLAEVKQLFGADGAVGILLRRPEFVEMMRLLNEARDVPEITDGVDPQGGRADV